MVSNQIFEYSDNFLDEIIENLQKQKAQNTNKQNNTYFINRLRAILGKTIEEDELSKIILLKNAEFKKKLLINSKFPEIKELNFWEKNSLKKLKKEFFYNQ